MNQTTFEFLIGEQEEACPLFSPPQQRSWLPPLLGLDELDGDNRANDLVCGRQHVRQALQGLARLSSKQPYGVDAVLSSRRDEGIMLLAKITQLASRIRT